MIQVINRFRDQVMTYHPDYDTEKLVMCLERSFLAPFPNPNYDNQATEFIYQIIETCTGVMKEDILERTRKHDIIRASHILLTMLYIFTKYSLNNIGLVAGKRDHATVLHSVWQTHNYLQTRYYIPQIECIFKHCYHNNTLYNSLDIYPPYMRMYNSSLEGLHKILTYKPYHRSPLLWPDPRFLPNNNNHENKPKQQSESIPELCSS